LANIVEIELEEVSEMIEKGSQIIVGRGRGWDKEKKKGVEDPGVGEGGRRVGCAVASQ
jgi:hypothetical protein